MPISVTSGQQKMQSSDELHNTLCAAKLCFWQITQANVVKLCSCRLAACDRPLVFTRGLCWIKHETVVLHLDGQPLGQV